MRNFKNKFNQSKFLRRRLRRLLILCLNKQIIFYVLIKINMKLCWNCMNYSAGKMSKSCVAGSPLKFLALLNELLELFVQMLSVWSDLLASFALQELMNWRYIRPASHSESALISSGIFRALKEVPFTLLPSHEHSAPRSARVLTLD